MNDVQLTTALESIAAIAVLSLLVFNFVSAYRLDSFRQRMFIARDKLWDFAASGRIGFDDPAYQLLRKLMNGFIRYGHQLTLFRVLMTTLHWRYIGQAPEFTWHRKWDAAISQVKEPDVREHLETLYDRAIWLMAKHLITGSPILMVLLAGTFMWFLARSGWTSLRQLLEDSGERSLAWVVDARLIEEDAAQSGSAPRLVYH